MCACMHGRCLGGQVAIGSALETGLRLRTSRLNLERLAWACKGPELPWLPASEPKPHEQSHAHCRGSRGGAGLMAQVGTSSTNARPTRTGRAAPRGSTGGSEGRWVARGGLTQRSARADKRAGEIEARHGVVCCVVLRVHVSSSLARPRLSKLPQRVV